MKKKYIFATIFAILSTILLMQYPHLRNFSGSMIQNQNSQIIFTENFDTLHNWIETDETHWSIKKRYQKGNHRNTQVNTSVFLENCTPNTYCPLSLANIIDISIYDDISISFDRYIDKRVKSDESLSIEILHNNQWISLDKWSNTANNKNSWSYESYDITNYRSKDFKIRFIGMKNRPKIDLGIDNITIKGTLLDTNIAPIAQAGPDQTIIDTDNTGYEIIRLDGAYSTDEDGYIAQYEWKNEDALIGTSATISGNYEIGNYVFTLTVTDNEGKTDTDEIFVTIQTP